MEKIQDIGRELMEYGIMKDDIQSDIDRLAERWNIFQNQVSFRSWFLCFFLLNCIFITTCN